MGPDVKKGSSSTLASQIAGGVLDQVEREPYLGYKNVWKMCRMISSLISSILFSWEPFCFLENWFFFTKIWPIFRIFWEISNKRGCTFIRHARVPRSGHLSTLISSRELGLKITLRLIRSKSRRVSLQNNSPKLWHRRVSCKESSPICKPNSPNLV